MDRKHTLHQLESEEKGEKDTDEMMEPASGPSGISAILIREKTGEMRQCLDA